MIGDMVGDANDDPTTPAGVWVGIGVAVDSNSPPPQAEGKKFQGRSG